MGYYSSRCEYSTLLGWLCYYHPFQIQKHILTEWFICCSHLPNVVQKFCFDLECVDDWRGCGFLMLLFWYFLRTRIILLESRQLMQLPLFCLRKPVPFEDPEVSEHTGYLLYTDLLCFGWIMLNEETSQRNSAAYLHFRDPQNSTRMFIFPRPQAGTAYSGWHKVQRHATGQRLDRQSSKRKVAGVIIDPHLMK